jgi:GNAT superfamily N-acetyltransferase
VADEVAGADEARVADEDGVADGEGALVHATRSKAAAAHNVCRMEIQAIGDERWAELKRVRLRALADSPQAFERTLAEELAMPEDEWHRRATPTDASANFLAVDGGGARGLVGVFREAEDHDLAHLVAMWVDPAARGRGIGGSLVDAVVQWCAAHAVPRVHLWVVESNTTAERLYRSRSFLPTGVRKRLPADPSLNEFEMARQIEGDTASVVLRP